MIVGTAVEDLLRELAPQVLGVLVRRHRDFEACEDAVQDALLAASRHWPAEGVPTNPRAWLVQTAGRRLTDEYRSDSARRRRERTAAVWEVPGVYASDRDDSLTMLFMCCHPALTGQSAVALTLRAIGGLTTAEIAAAFLVPEATMAQRISRAKQKIKTSEVPIGLPTSPDEWAVRMRSVLRVLYLIFNEGYASTTGAELHRVELSTEAIRLARMVHRLRPDDGEVTGLLALMLLTDARRPARTGPRGELIPLGEQDRSLWNRHRITEGTALIATALAAGRPGEYQLQAAIAALHDEALRVEDTDWLKIGALYERLEQLTGNPVVTLNRAVAVAMTDGPAAGLALLDSVADRLGNAHRLEAVRAHLFELAGDPAGAAERYRAAAAATASAPERDYLIMRAARLSSGR